MTDNSFDSYSISIDLLIPSPIARETDVTHAFADAEQFEELGTDVHGDKFQVTHGVNAPNGLEAYHRARNLVDAKLAALAVDDYGVLDAAVFGPHGREVLDLE